MTERAARRRWVISAVTAVALAAGAVAGLGLRHWERPVEVVDIGAVGSPSAAPAAPTQQPGPRVVRLTDDAAKHTRADEVHQLLQNHFDAINEGDYQLWTRTVTAERARATSGTAWRQQYRTTLDGSVLLHRLEPLPGGDLLVLLSFTSVQDPADAPADLPVRCLHWQVSYPLTVERGELRLALSAPAMSQRRAC